MRIGMVLSTKYPPEEGIGYYVHNLSKELMARGHEITIITRGGLAREEETIDEMRIIRVPFLMTYPLHIKLHGHFLSALLRERCDDFDLLHFHSPLVPPPPKLNIPIVSTIHTSIIENTRHVEASNTYLPLIKFQTEFISHPLIKKLMKRSNAVTTVSKSVADELEKYYGQHEITIIGNGVDETTFRPSSNDGKERYMLYTGRLSHRKGISDLLEAAPIILENRDVKLFICGKGELENNIRRRIKSMEIEDRVLILGHVDREYLIDLYRHATLFCLPSLYEGLPTVALEAMASGVPIIARRIPSVDGLIVDGQNGLLFDDISSLVQKACALLDNEELRRHIANKARNTIIQSHTWPQICDRVETVYREICHD